jgi:hypothetical protein
MITFFIGLISQCQLIRSHYLSWDKIFQFYSIDDRMSHTHHSIIITIFVTTILLILLF